MSKNKFKKFDIASRVLEHGANKLEIKLEYNLEDLVKTNNYKIETYFFIPRELKISKSTYPKEDFYADTKNYIRFMNPLYTLAQIIDPSFKPSPIYALNQIIKNYSKPKKEKDQQKQAEQIIKELKLLGTMVRARLRDWRIFVRQNLNDRKNFKNMLILADFKGRLKNCQKVLQEFRKLQKLYSKIIQDKQIEEYFQIVEEFISNIVEERLIQVLILIEDNIKPNKELTQTKDKLKIFLKKEQAIRKRKKFKLILKNTAQNREKYLYYFNQYKKVVSSVLYLDIARNIKRMTYKHVVAAWTAFFIAAINSYIAIYIFKAYAANTILFIIAMALLYVFKDRAKNIFKLIVGAKTLSRFPDSYTTIKDDLGKKTINLGEIREKVFFPVDNQISQTVLDLRKKTSVLSKNILDKILVYQKEINVKTSIIKKYYDRTTNLTDIMRFNLDKFLANMGDPKKLIYYYDQGANSLEASEGARVYNLGLIIKYTKLAKRKKKILHYEYYNIVCTKFGIKRVEFIERI